MRGAVVADRRFASKYPLPQSIRPVQTAKPQRAPTDMSDSAFTVVAIGRRPPHRPCRRDYGGEYDTPAPRRRGPVGGARRMARQSHAVPRPRSRAGRANRPQGARAVSEMAGRQACSPHDRTDVPRRIPRPRRRGRACDRTSRGRHTAGYRGRGRARRTGRRGLPAPSPIRPVDWSTLAPPTVLPGLGSPRPLALSRLPASRMVGRIPLWRRRIRTATGRTSSSASTIANGTAPGGRCD